ncbi:MAG: 50S ribosomal protein L29 [Patescibacteria group bacterium]
MDKKEFEQFKSKSIAELEGALMSFRDNLHVLKFDLSLGKVKNIREIRKVKKVIAKLLTLKNSATAIKT